MITLGSRGDLLTTCTIEVLTNLKTMSALFLFGFDFSFISEYILRVSTEWRPHVHHSSFRAFRPFDSGFKPRSCCKMMKHGPLYPFFYRLSRVAMAFRQRCLKDGSSLLVVWLEVGTVRSGMCFGFALAEETKW